MNLKLKRIEYLFGIVNLFIQIVMIIIIKKKGLITIMMQDFVSIKKKYMV